MTKYFDAIIIVPLEEEFEVVLEKFSFDDDLSTSQQVMFSVHVPENKLRILVVKQSRMGKTGTQEAVLNALSSFDTGLLVCIGIAGSLSSDVAIGDVCYSGQIIDVLDNVKATDTPASTQELALSPYVYNSPREIATAFSLDRLNPKTKAGHEAWATEQHKFAEGLIPNEFSGREGRKEKIARPSAREGSIACGIVSASPEYNKKIRAIDRKVLAIETESGALFSIAQQRSIHALTIRGISDYAGVDKAIFERETGNNARKVAISNAASYLVRQLGTPRIVEFFDKIRQQNSVGLEQLQLPNLANKDGLYDLIIQHGDELSEKLHDLAPGYRLCSKGYHLPVPRIRTIDVRGAAGPEARQREPIEIRDALRDARIITLHVPREYPDLSLPWIIANDLMSAQLGDKKPLPIVIAGASLQRPRTGLAQLISSELKTATERPEVQTVFIIDSFNFESRSRLAFLKQEIDAWPEAKFVIVTRSRANVVLESEFTKNIASCTANLCDISFVEISHFIQKNFEMGPSASEVVAFRLRETFNKYALSAHPSYFAGIPRSTLYALLQVNRKAELIELAVAGYLSFVVSEDTQDVKLSRTTREKFLAEFAYAVNAEKRKFREEEITAFAADFARKYDYRISPARFVAQFIENGILHVEGGYVRFTLPFIESYLLAIRLSKNPAEALRYFSQMDATFDHRTFALYAEIGPSEEMVDEIMKRLDLSIANISVGHHEDVFLKGSVCPALLRRQDRLHAIQQQIQKAEEAVRDNRDQSHEKQKLLDANDRIREEVGSKLYKMQPTGGSSAGVATESVEVNAAIVWAVAVSLLGSGAERIEAKVKRELVGKIVKLSVRIINAWTKTHCSVKFNDLKEKVTADEKIVKSLAKSDSDEDIASAKKTLEYVVDFIEYAFMMQPFISVAAYLCDEARDNVLVESISNTSVDEALDGLLRNMWLTDIDVPSGRKQLLVSIKSLPKGLFLRSAIAAHLLARVYWRHWRQEDQLHLLDVANESLVGAGLSYNKSQLKRIIENLPEADEPI